MRLLLKLVATKNCEYDLKYFHKLQGFIYGLLKGTVYSLLHDKKGYKFFCFSNIFPIGDVENGDKRNLIVSSPDKFFLKILKSKLQELIDKNKLVNIGDMPFEIENVSLIKTNLQKNFRLISATPIIIRIPEKRYEEYNINKRKERYVYWRKEYSFEAFVKQLEENLFKKYNEFYKSSISRFPLFEQFLFKKETCNHVIIKGKEYKLIGSIWEFIFSYLNKEQKKILEFGVDCGFGERNSLGFGFMNVVR